MRVRRVALRVLVLLSLGAFLLPGVAEEKELRLEVLGADQEPLRAAFNGAAGKVRLLLLLDPT